MLDLKRVLAAKPRKHEVPKKAELSTPWGEQLDPSAVLAEHPTPQFARERWQNLNGYWDYAITKASCGDAGGAAGGEAGDAGDADGDAAGQAVNAPSACGHAPESADLPKSFDGKILVPFSPEAPLSGVGRAVQPDDVLWYRRLFDVPQLQSGERLLLHFQAVDYQCTCYVNGRKAGSHTGGYLPFCIDITDAMMSDEIAASSQVEVVLRVTDPSDDGTQLRGKQKLVPSDIWYTAQSGIWQTVWCEIVPAAHIASVRLDADYARGGITICADVTAAGTLRASVHAADGVCVGEAEAAAEAANGRLVAEAFVPIDAPRMWSPDDPYLYTVQLAFAGESAGSSEARVVREADLETVHAGDAEGLAADRVTSYTAFRSCEVRPDADGIPRFFLNGEQLLLKGVLDQGYWPDGLMTAPADEALVFDIQSAKELGFNMMRKHIKIESERWYYHCDRLGMLVWQDMVSGGGMYGKWYTSQFPTLFKSLWTRLSDEGPAHYGHFAAEDAAYRDEWRETCAGAIGALRNHPCIVTWVLFNEAWGQFDARGMTEFARGLDATRPIDSTSGWYDQRAGDYFSVHNYFRDLEVYDDPLRKQAGGASKPARAFAISEFGGLTWHIPGHSSCEVAYGYDAYETPQKWFEAVTTQLATMEVLEAQGLAAYVYTQLSDIEEETNGLLTYDRRVNKVHQALASLKPAPQREATGR